MYVSSDYLSVQKFDRLSGAQLWSVELNSPGFTQLTPVAVDHGVAVRAGTGYILAGRDGRLLGAFSSATPPAIADRRAYTLDFATLEATSFDTGSLLWGFRGDGHLVTAPIVVNGFVFIGSSSGMLFAVDARTGRLTWSADVGAPMAPRTISSSRRSQGWRPVAT